MYPAKAPLDPHLRDALVLSVKLPDTAGKTLYFPTLQNCVKGQTDWKELPKEGQDPHSLEAPAPSFTVTAAAGHGDHGAAAASGAEAEQAASVSGSSDSGSSAGGADARSWAGLVAGLAGLGLGGAAFFRKKKSA